MIHFGDITKINGAEVPLVDIVCGGSPCQDLSVAGRRAGLAGERSGLFMEQIRIIKEMRNECIRQLSMRGADEPVRPRYMVWENVPGAFSSNKGEDFRAVLEETARVADENAVIPRLAEKQRWSPSGCILGEGWSIAWRLHDSQFWGVPQRRKRLALVADFTGESAGEILFEREGLSGDSFEIREKGETTSGVSKKSIGETISIGNGQADIFSHITHELAQTLNCMHDPQAILQTFRKTSHPRSAEDAQGWEETNVNDTLNTFDSGELRTSTLVLFEPRSQDGVHRLHEDNICPTLNTAQGGQRQPCVSSSIVRRLTPLEYERLQGFPDGWTDIGEWTDSKGKKHKDADSPRYKALGNSIALPFWEWMAERMVKQLGSDHPTMASLFDGIGGFPLVFSRCGCDPVWASEIEEFPIAVTKKHFPEGGD